MAIFGGDAEPSRAFEFKEQGSLLGVALAGAAIAFYALVGFEDSVNEHFVVPSVVPVVGIGISIALLTQIEAEIYGRAAILVALGVVLWVVNWLILRAQGEREATAPPST